MRINNISEDSLYSGYRHLTYIFIVLDN